MINRVLIRVKVVQMLYSYLLTRSEFKIETAPESASRDKRYAYTAYVNLLLLILELSGYNVCGPTHKSQVPALAKGTRLASTKMAHSLAQDEEVRTLIMRGRNDIKLLDDVAARLNKAILSSTAYKDFSKIKDPEIKDEAQLWRTIINTIIVRDEQLTDILRQNPDFTVKGFETGAKMLVNTLTGYSDTRTLLSDAHRDLVTSLDKAYELYHSLLWLTVELTRLQERRIDTAKEKYLATDDDLNPNTRFIDNKFIAALASNQQFEEYRNQNPITWADNHLLLKSILDRIVASDIYNAYMSGPDPDFAADCELWRQIMKNIILPDEDLAESMESMSVYWNDDLSIMGTFVIKTIKQFARDGESTRLLEKYKDQEDEKFGPTLFGLAVENHEEYRAIIDRHIDAAKWDTERIALMDIVILETALSEILNFPSVPLAVSVNEYVEIANWYSTARSGAFVNGLLASATSELRESGRLLKS